MVTSLTRAQNVEDKTKKEKQQTPMIHGVPAITVNLEVAEIDSLVNQTFSCYRSSIIRRDVNYIGQIYFYENLIF